MTMALNVNSSPVRSESIQGHPGHEHKNPFYRVVTLFEQLREDYKYLARPTEKVKETPPDPFRGARGPFGGFGHGKLQCRSGAMLTQHWLPLSLVQPPEKTLGP